MNTKLLSTLTAAAAASFQLSLSQAQAASAHDTASNAAYAKGYGNGQNGGTGFTPFKVTATGAAGTFIFTAKESEGNKGKPAPSSIDSPPAKKGGSPLSFGLYAQKPGAVVTITRGFTAPLAGRGNFSLDFVTGYNDGPKGSGSSGVSLMTSAGPVGSFAYRSTDHYYFNGAVIPGQGYKSGAFHLVYTLTSPTSYSLSVTGPFKFTGTGTLKAPVTGFRVQQANSAMSKPDHNAYFNNLAASHS